MSPLTVARTRTRGFPSQLWLLATGTLVFLLGIETAFPFITLYMRERLGVSMTAIGLIFGVAVVAGLPMQLIGGYVLDRVGRRGVLILSICASIALYEGFALSQDLALLVAVIVIEAVFGWPLYLLASNAMVADLTPPQRRMEGYGITRTAVHCGALLGPVLGALLLRGDASYRLAFGVGGAICAVFLVMAVVAVRETKPGAASKELTGWGLSGFRAVVRDRHFLMFCGIALLPLYCYGQFMLTVPVVLRQVSGITPSAWGLLLAMNGAVAAVLQFPVSRFVRSRDLMLMMALTSVLMGVGVGGAAAAPPSWAVPILVLLVGMGTVLLFPVSSTLVARFAPVALRGRYLGVWMVVWMSGMAAGPALGGVSLDRLGYRPGSLISLAVGLAGAVAFVLLRRIQPAASDGVDAGDSPSPGSWSGRSPGDVDIGATRGGD
jgi:MFS family permease